MAVKAVLKYKKIAQGHPFKARELILEFDGKRHNDYLPHDTRVLCLKRALKKLNAEIENVAETFKDHKLGAYLWLYTPNVIRGEELEGLYRLYYLLEIVKYLRDEDLSNELVVETNLNRHGRQILRKEGIRLKYNKTACIRSYFISTVLGLKSIYTSVIFNVKCLFQKPNQQFKGALVDSSPNFRTNRYDNIKKVEELYKSVRYFASQQNFVSGIEPEKTIVFREEINLRIVVAAFVKATRIALFIINNKSSIPAGLYQHLSTFFNLLLYNELIIAELCFKKYLDKCEISKIVMVSTLTIPSHRLLISLAKNSGTEVINVASRTYGPYESSDILLNCDVNENNNTRLPGWFVLKDRYSFDKAFAGRPQLSSRVFIGGRYPSLARQAENDVQSLPAALLILFNHKQDISYRLLRAVEQSGLQSQVSTIIYRCHHIFVFGEEVISNAFPDNRIINITGKDYSALNDFRVVAITGPTTAAMEVIQLGAVVVWAPWVWDESIIIDDVMRNVGALTQNLPELTTKTQTFLEDKRAFINQYQKDLRYCKEFFNTTETISEQLEKIERINF